MLLCDENKISESENDKILLEKISYSFLKNFLEISKENGVALLLQLHLFLIQRQTLFKSIAFAL